MPEPRVLLYDIENSYAIGGYWPGQLYDRNIVTVIQNWYMLSVAWQWYGEKKVHVMGLDDYEGYDPAEADDFDLCADLHDLFNEADVIIAHNGDGFDRPKAETRMWLHGFDPPSPVKTVDTLAVARRRFKGGLDSRTLDALAERLGVQRKGHSGGIETWTSCMEGDPEAWRKLKKYNKQDVAVLHEVYDKMRPWIPRHPNLATISGRKDSCSTCGASGCLSKQGFLYTQTMIYQRWKCKNCGSWLSSVASEKNLKPEYTSR